MRQPFATSGLHQPERRARREVLPLHVGRPRGPYKRNLPYKEPQTHERHAAEMRARPLWAGQRGKLINGLKKRQSALKGWVTRRARQSGEAVSR